MEKESTYWDAIAILIVYSLLSTPGYDDRQKNDVFSVHKMTTYPIIYNKNLANTV